MLSLPSEAPPSALRQLAWAHLRAVGATRAPELLHCAAENCEAHNPNIVVRYGMEGRVQIVDVAQPE